MLTALVLAVPVIVLNHPVSSLFLVSIVTVVLLTTVLGLVLRTRRRAVRVHS